MRTISIIGTDWSGPNPAWVRQPFLDEGRLHFDRLQRADWDNVFYELCGRAQIPCLAVGIRGAWDTGAVESLPIARAAYDEARPQPTLCPWFDTVGLPDVVNVRHVTSFEAIPFDCANPQHLAWAWDRYARVFFDHFGTAHLERSPTGKILICWWGISSTNGWGFTNQRSAQRLLDAIDARLVERGLGPADHLVDKTWLELCPTLEVYGVHDWFEAWSTPPRPSSIRTHRGVTVGVTVPSFYRTINPNGDGETLRQTLAAMRAHVPPVDYVLLESGTNFSEGAELMRDARGNTSKLDAVREHIELTHPSHEHDKDTPMITATFSIRRSERIPHPRKPGYWTSPYPGTTTGEVLSVNPPDGHIESRPKGADGGYEAWREAEGNRAVFDDVDGYTFAFPLVD